MLANSLLFLVSPLILATGSSNAPSEASDLWDSFGNVCVLNLGDAGSQADSAKDQGWSLVDEQVGDDEIQLKFEELNVNILTDSSKTCAITSKINQAMSFATFTDHISKFLGGAPPNEVVEPDTVYWLIEPEDRNETFAISLMVSTETENNLATIMISKP